jgi:GNAT superfamily N-acetyltransferase
MIEIVNMAYKKELTYTVIDWLWQEWGNINNYRFFEDLVKNSDCPHDIPQTFVALMGGLPVGTVSLWRNDLKSRQDFYPWLGALFVAQEFRHQGIGVQLQRFAITQAAKLGYDNLYLFTELEGYYDKSGWDYIGESTDYEGEAINLYKFNLK